MVRMMKSHGIILLSLLLSGVAEAARTAPVPTLTLTRRAERRAAPVDRIAMETASREVNGALVEFRRAANDLRISFESSPEYSAAVLAMGEARMKLGRTKNHTLFDEIVAPLLSRSWMVSPALIPKAIATKMPG